MTDQHSALVINCGSSSIKFALYNQQQQLIFSGLAERLGNQQAQLSYRYLDQDKQQILLEDSHDHLAALNQLMSSLQSLDLLKNIKGIGHRVVHGGEQFSQSMQIDKQSLAELTKLNHLAPLHNPVNILGIEVCQKLLPEVAQVAVFDTAFHQTIAQHAYLYAVPFAWYENHGVRRYGFHGTSYRYISQAASDILQKPTAQLNLVVAHLGNGCSGCAIKQGQSVDTSMGLTPLEGMAMGTRSGDIDPGLIDFIGQLEQLDNQQIMNVLNKQSGLLGLSQSSNDMRTLLAQEAEGDQQATIAIDTFCYRAARQLAAISSSLPYIDALVFTGGIGEHSSVIRQRILNYWQAGQWQVDSQLNQQHGNQQGRISAENSPQVLVVATNEELMIAQDTFALCIN